MSGFADQVNGITSLIPALPPLADIGTDLSNRLGEAYTAMATVPKGVLELAAQGPDVAVGALSQVTPCACSVWGACGACSGLAWGLETL